MSDNLTPMMRQYHAVRRDLPPNTLLLFRLGDFYELFFDDAKEASSILNVALTKRGTTPMCGVPFHAAKNYIQKLIEAGKKVALVDQVGEVQAGKLVRRELTQIISPGSLDDFGLDERKNNYLAVICRWKSDFGFAYADLSTGEFRVTQLAHLPAVLDELARVSPSETIIPEEQAEVFAAIEGVTAINGYVFETENARQALIAHFKVHSLDGFGLGDLPAGIGSAGALLYYLTRQLRRSVDHFRSLQPYRQSQFLMLDVATQSHLELVESRAGRTMTLLGALDRSVTPMGARTLRDWILHPLREQAPIQQRQNGIRDLLDNPFSLADLRLELGGIRDLERSTARLCGTSGNPRDLAALKVTLLTVPKIKSFLGTILSKTGEAGILADLQNRLHELPELVTVLDSALVDEPPALLRDGGVIRPGYHALLDELRAASREGKDWIANLQEREIVRTGIKSLKVRYNSVFGYFIEVTKSNLSSVPEDYHRKQTTTNAERFITPELKEIEGKILGADERSKALEIELFQELRHQVLAHLAALQDTAAAIGALDALGSLAETARLHRYCRPTIEDSGRLLIREGRHPVLDQRALDERFIPNDTDLDQAAHRFAIITGPNMAGKSTYIRQVALLTLMAQIGSYLPAEEAVVGLVDRIFTRVGASDDLAKGQSTFMVEMNETANIIHNATENSLVILDEIGRGTSTFDGLSIAWSVAEYLHDTTKARTLFATHYHELTDLERTRPGVINLNVAVREWNDEVIFLRKIIPGRADQSYGIQVARLAGLPASIIHRAKEILSNLEQAELNAEGKPEFAQSRRRRPSVIRTDISQLPLFQESRGTD